MVVGGSRNATSSQAPAAQAKQMAASGRFTMFFLARQRKLEVIMKDQYQISNAKSASTDPGLVDKIEEEEEEETDATMVMPKGLSDQIAAGLASKKIGSA